MASDLEQDLSQFPPRQNAPPTEVHRKFRLATAVFRFMKTLKYEEVHRNEYRDLAEARAAIHELEKVYNQKRLHSALGYLPPIEFEQNIMAQNNKDAAARQLSL
jgi:transposase InsO family protein